MINCLWNLTLPVKSVVQCNAFQVWREAVAAIGCSSTCFPKQHLKIQLFGSRPRRRYLDGWLFPFRETYSENEEPLSSTAFRGQENGRTGKGRELVVQIGPEGDSALFLPLTTTVESSGLISQ